jgi:hypothetical protein
VRTSILAIAATIVATACTGSEPSRSSEDSKAQDKRCDELMKKHRETLRAGETDLVDDDYVRNGPK